MVKGPSGHVICDVSCYTSQFFPEAFVRDHMLAAMLLNKTFCRCCAQFCLVLEYPADIRWCQAVKDNDVFPSSSS